MEVYGEVAVLVSGAQAEVTINHPIKWQLHGLSFICGKNGGIDLFKTFKKAKLFRLFSNLFKCEENQYDLIINDFEQINA